MAMLNNQRVLRDLRNLNIKNFHGNAAILALIFGNLTY